MAAHTAQQKEGDVTAFWANISDVPFSVSEIPSPFFAEVDPPRVMPMRLADGPSQAAFGRRDCDQMGIIRHQAVTPNLHPLFAAPAGHQFQVGRIVSVVEERLLSAVPPLRYVVRHTRNDQSCQPCHPRNLPDSSDPVKISYVSPEFVADSIGPRPVWRASAATLAQVRHFHC